MMLRGDGHCSTPEVHAWSERQEPGIDSILRQSGHAVLQRPASGLLDQARSLYRYHQVRAYRKQTQEDRRQQQSTSKKGAATSRQQDQEQTKVVRKSKLYTTFFYQAESWSEPRRIICKVEVSDAGENIRFIVTNLKTPRTTWIYETIYCGRGQMEHYIKDHKLFLHADRTSCHRFEANQFRVFLHSAA